jgi:hypothetical protein
MAYPARARRLGLSLAVLFGTALPADAGQTLKRELPETARSEVGYETVAAAMADLRSNRNVVFTTENGWLIATNEVSYTIWSFSPKGYAAYPAVVKRQVTAQAVGSKIEMSVLCEASKKACDDLVRTFAAMNGLRLDQ